MPTFFSDFFGISPNVLHRYGAFNVSLVNDLPLFIDPFLLFNSKKRAYRKLHHQIIEYLIFLRDKASTTEATEANLRLWYCFREVKQNWLGFSRPATTVAVSAWSLLCRCIAISTSSFTISERNRSPS